MFCMKVFFHMAEHMQIVTCRQRGYAGNQGVRKSEEFVAHSVLVKLQLSSELD